MWLVQYKIQLRLVRRRKNPTICYEILDLGVMREGEAKIQAEKDAQVKRQEKRFSKMIEAGNTHSLRTTLSPHHSQLSQSQTQTQNTSYHGSSLLDISVGGGASQTSRQQPILLEIPQSDVDDFFRVMEKKVRANLKKGEPGQKAKDRIEQKAAKLAEAEAAPAETDAAPAEADKK